MAQSDFHFECAIGTVKFPEIPKSLFSFLVNRSDLGFLFFDCLKDCFSDLRMQGPQALRQLGSDRPVTLVTGLSLL